MQLFAASLPFFVFTDNALAATQGFQTMRAYVWVGQVLEPVLRLGLTVGVLVAGGGIAAAALALLVSSLVSAAAAAVALIRLLGALPGDGADTPARELATFSMQSWVSSMATQGLLWADILILGVLATAREVGAYQVAARVVLVGMVMITPLTSSMAPRISYAWAHRDRDLVTRRYVSIVLWSARLSFPVLAGMLAVPAAVLGIFGNDFGDASMVVIILGAGAVAEAVGAPSSVLLNQIGRNRINMTINICALVFNIALNLLLIPPFGIEGSAFAWSATLVGGALVRIVVVRRVATDRWPWSRGLAAAALGGGLALLAGWGATTALPRGSILQVLVAAVVVPVVYAVVVIGWGLDRTERDLVTRAVTLRVPALRRWRVQWQLRKAAASIDELPLESLVSPFRFDVLARADLFRLARAHALLRDQDFPAFLELVRASRYGDWFVQVLVARGHVPSDSRAQERTFRSIVLSSLQLMDRHDRLGRESLGKVSVRLLPAGSDLGGWSLGEDRWVLLDGGHRVALALLAGHGALGPDDYVIESEARPPNNTSAFLDAGSTTTAEALSFLALGLVAPEHRDRVTSWDTLLEHLAVDANREPMRAWPHASRLADVEEESPITPAG